MTISTLLQLPAAVKFDAKNAEHRAAYVNFIDNGKWNMKFELEFPFSSLPSMVMYKLALLACSAEGAVDNSALLSKSAYLPTEKATAVNDQQLEKVA